jgi:hypothetical protein
LQRVTATKTLGRTLLQIAAVPLQLAQAMMQENLLHIQITDQLWRYWLQVANP